MFVAEPSLCQLPVQTQEVVLRLVAAVSGAVLVAIGKRMYVRADFPAIAAACGSRRLDGM